jgi:hypothetical protein
MGRERGQGRHPEIEEAEASFQETELNPPGTMDMSRHHFFYIAYTYTLFTARLRRDTTHLFALLFFRTIFFL